MEVRGDSVHFINHGKRRCLHGTSHTNRKCHVNFMRNGALLYHCCSSRCKTRDDVPMGNWEPETKFDASLISVMNRLAQEWPDHAGGFDMACLAYMNR